MQSAPHLKISGFRYRAPRAFRAAPDRDGSDVAAPGKSRVCPPRQASRFDTPRYGHAFRKSGLRSHGLLFRSPAFRWRLEVRRLAQSRRRQNSAQLRQRALLLGDEAQPHAGRQLPRRREL